MSEKMIFQEIENPETRAQAIKDNCDEVLPNYAYMRRFTDEELTEFKNEFSEESIELDTLKTELENISKGIKEKMKPRKQNLKQLLKNLREKAEQFKEECYVLKSETTYDIYNSEGELLYTRALKTNEKQKTIQMKLREGTNN
jgi:hypothetical protein